MYRLLIVDDEPAVRDGLRDNIAWESVDVSEVLTASSSAEALEHLDRRAIDLVITDIVMPGMSGLEFAKIVHDRSPGTAVIILTGHEEFDYARIAIEFGVYRFLTKPVANETLAETVKAAIRLLKQRETELGTGRRILQRLEEVRPLLREKFISAWIASRAALPQDFDRKLAEFGVPFDSSAPFFLVLTAFRTRRALALNSNTNEGTLECVRSILESYLGTRLPVAFRDLEGNIICLVQEEERKEIERHAVGVRNGARTLVERIEKHTGRVASLFWSEIERGADAASGMYRETAKRAGTHLTGNFGMGGGPGGAEIAATPRPASFSLQPSIKELLSAGDEAAVFTRLEEIVRELEDLKELPRVLLFEAWHLVLGALTELGIEKGIQISEWLGSDAEGFLMMNADLAAFESSTRMILERFFRCIQVRNKKRAHAVVENAKRYFIERYQESISVKALAKTLFVHPNYLSTLFHEVEGIPLSEFLMRVRIDRAKMLLREPGIRAYEVAEMVGYASSAHFNRTFKRITGVTPKEYQNRP